MNRRISDLPLMTFGFPYEILIHQGNLKQQPMREVIRLNDKSNRDKKPLELTHCLQVSSDNWLEIDRQDAQFYDEIAHLGYFGGSDRFACYNGLGHLTLWKGRLNSGKY